MGLDIYAGSLTRYYARAWETIVQRHARETGMELRVIRANEPDDAITDPDEIRAAVLDWRDQLNAGLGEHLQAPLHWDESAQSPYFTDKPAWDCWGALQLWAAYCEHPDLQRPQAFVEEWTADPAWQRSTAAGFRTRWPTLLRETEIWLPAEFDFTFAAPDLSGHTVNFGSVHALCDELAELNDSSWNADARTLAIWREQGAGPDSPLETGARFAFAILWELATQARRHALVLKLDY